MSALIDRGELICVAPGPDLIERLRTAVGQSPIYIHFDCDVLDKGLISAEYQVSGGMTLQELSKTMNMLARHDVVGIEIAEFEATWPNGMTASPDALITALTAILTA